MQITSLLNVSVSGDCTEMNKKGFERYAKKFFVDFPVHEALNSGQKAVFPVEKIHAIADFKTPFTRGEFRYQSHSQLLAFVSESLREYGPSHFGWYAHQDPRLFLFASLISAGNMFVISSLSPILDLRDVAEKGKPTKYSVLINPLMAAMDEAGVEDKAAFFVQESVAALTLLNLQEKILECAQMVRRIHQENACSVVNAGFKQAVELVNKTALYLEGSMRKNMPQFPAQNLETILSQAA